ncbi:hypothetical protein D7D52_28785 [Nocardia yunnanensis]|uniref:Resolvase/invertase-type recombinase catalytic domain-containing protein n=1 Tax=Nocardia yunnanensis TaxID=2382165 RepID=A0A386ZIE0_9NOCA|nr:hypothetical protein [Nocardia yunnanensis]AYF77150.1 hypothetical protein D7D52_28785 [Nocardia yunnanensis]
MKFRPTAVGYLRCDVSGAQQQWDEDQIRSVAKRMGYDLAKIVVVDGRGNERPLVGLKTTVTRLGAEAVFTASLAHFPGEDVPADLVRSVDVVTVSPENTYARAGASS